MSEKSSNSQWHTSHSLLNQISDPEDQKSWEKFVLYYNQYIYNILRRFGLSHDETDDLRQHIFVKLWEIMPDSPYQKDRGKFRHWLAGVIKNEAMDFMDKKIRRRNLLDKNAAYVEDQLQEAGAESTLDQIIESEWQNHLMKEAWDEIQESLSEPSKTVFQLALQGKSIREISEHCDISENSVRVYKSRVKNLIKTAIADNETLPDGSE